MIPNGWARYEVRSTYRSGGWRQYEAAARITPKRVAIVVGLPTWRFDRATGRDVTASTGGCYESRLLAYRHVNNGPWIATP